MQVVLDTETNAIHNPTKLWVIVAKEVESGKVHIFRNPGDDPEAFREFASHIDSVIGHNFIGYDLDVIRNFCNVSIPLDVITDTLVVSRLVNADIAGGHSLEAWGERLGSAKIHFKAFEAFSEEMVTYCVQDVELTLKVYQHFQKHITSPKWAEALRLEHDIALMCREMRATGFAFDLKGAQALYSIILKELETLDIELTTAFTPRSKLLREILPKETKHGTLHRQDFRWEETGDLSAYSAGHPFSLITFEPFNPGSPKQIVERLNEAGWQPYEKTKGHIAAERELKRCKDKLRRAELVEKLLKYSVYGWSISTDNLATLPAHAPEAARKLVRRLLLASRASTLREWFEAFDEASGRIHGNFNHIGAWTHRMSHSSPNMANIPSGDTAYAHEMRSLWRVPEDSYLVGVDAEGIQLRILAHYMDDKAFTESLVTGRKEDGTDPHSLNQRALGPICKSRDDAKTFIYAWLLGAGLAKVAAILGCSLAEAKEAVDNFVKAYPGLKRLKEEIIPRDAARGYFIGLDGRFVLCDNEHLMLAGYLQNGESVVMKKASILWRNKLISENVPFRLVNLVHDEWQTEVPKDLELAKYVAQTQADSLEEVGRIFNMNCPLAGSILGSNKELAIGSTWSQTH